MLILPAAIAGLIALHLYLVIRLGVTSPPWSKEAAGTGPIRPSRRRTARARTGLASARGRDARP